MRIFSWNVNGYRAVLKKNFLEWLKSEQPDVVCLQETKVRREQLTDEQVNPLGYEGHLFSAEKPGYSGVGLLTKKPLIKEPYNMGLTEIDSEGRVMFAEFEDFVLVNAYFPNSQREHGRLDYKLAFCDVLTGRLIDFVESGKNIVLCGDYNVAHKEIDLKNPKANQNNAGFLPAERDWMTSFVNAGFVDCFRQFDQGPDKYTWWSYRPGVREKNIGWRIDYFCTNNSFIDNVKSCEIHADVMGSDHCPISIEID